MMQQWQKLAQKIDALSLRERGVVFATIALALLFMVNRFLLEPQFSRQSQLAAQIAQDQATMNELQSAIQQKIAAHKIDPDAVGRTRLQALNQQMAQMQNSLANLQKGLVSPERMSSLLEDILRRNGKLRLVALKTLPVAVIGDETDKTASSKVASATQGSEVASTATGAIKPAEKASGIVYKHGVEITIQGSYSEMLHYMAELETMPWQLYWGRAEMRVDEYPQATLTLTLFTLSLDKKWLNL